MNLIATQAMSTAQSPPNFPPWAGRRTLIENVCFDHSGTEGYLSVLCPDSKYLSRMLVSTTRATIRRPRCCLYRLEE